MTPATVLDRVRTARIVAAPSDRYSLGAWLPDALAGVQVQIIGIDELELRPGHSDLDLLFAPTRGLDAHDGLRFARAAGSGALGALTLEDGVILHRGDRSTLETFYAARGEQSDAIVYGAGPTTRASFEADPASLPAPRQVYLGLTQKCDRSCDFCVSRTFDFDLLSMDEIDRFVEELHGDLDVIALTGAGEAMMHPQFWDVLDRLHRGFPEAIFKMNTSGLSLMRHSDDLLKYPIRNITVSLNAATSETYALYVGRGLRGLMKGIERLVEARAAHRASQLRLCLSMVLMKSTLPELSQMVQMAFEYGVEEVQGIYLMIHTENLAHESPWHDQEASNCFLDEAESLGRRLGVLTSLPERFMGTATNGYQTASLPTSHGHRCTEVFTTAYLRPNGALTPCPYFDATVGDTRKDGFLGVWHGDEYAAIRRGIVEGDLPGPCRSCAGFCEQGRVDNYSAHWLGVRGAAGSRVPLKPTRR